MKGFKIKCLTDTGKEALTSKLNANKKIFVITEENSSPYTLRFSLKTNRLTAGLWSHVKSKDLIKPVNEAMKEAGATIGVDYEVEVLE